MKIKQILYGLIVVALLGLTCFPISALAEEKTTLKVGYMDYHGFIDKASDGVNYTGYGADYLKKISEYSNFAYEYVYGEWSDLLAQLERGDIDLLCTAQYTDERAQVYDYSAYPIGYTQGLLYTRDDNEDMCYEDFAAFDGMTVGALRDTAMTDLFLKYATQNGFSCVIREYDTETELAAALNRGDIKAMCSEHLANHTDMSLLAKFGADAYYIISYKNSPYMADINFALQQIKTDVDFEAELFHKYYDSSSAESTLQFTLEEKQYKLAHADSPIVVGLMADRSPLSYIDENGQAAGMLVDLLNLVEERSGLNFEYRFLNYGQTGFDFMTNAGGDMVAGVASSAFSTPNPMLLQSHTLQSTSIVFVGRNGTDFKTDASLRVALPAGFINGETVVSALYPNFSYYKATSNEECLTAIRDGKADVMLQNMYVVRECLQSPLYDDLAIFPAFAFSEDEKIVALPDNKILMAIVNKSIDAITDEQRNDIVIQHTIAKSYHANLGEIMYKYRVPLLGIAALVLIVVAMFILVLIIRQKNYLAVEKMNGQLESAVLQAHAANTAKSRFLSQMSHEIRTPMNAIVGLTEIAKQHEQEPEKVDDYLGKISVSSKVLLNILNDVLDMSAIESGKLKIANERFDVKQILTGISTIYYPQCKSKGITFTMATDVEDEFLLGDSLRVSQILLNLVSNAYKFTDQGGRIKIYVKESSRKDNKAFLTFSVSDTGCGISDEMKERLFKPFEQETAGTAGRHGGSGLGLSIAKNLVDMMHGAISVDSVKGRGTTFNVELPFDILEDAVKYDGDALKNVRILVVDDDETAREYTGTVLHRIDASFDVANSGEEALSMIAEAQKSGKPYSVALIDWKMPDMDGLEVTRRIRAQEEERTLIVIVSAYDLNEVQDEAKIAGADHFVAKPLFQSTVFDVLMSLTNGGLKEQPKKADDYDFTGHKVLLAEDQELNAEIAIELLGFVHMAADHAVNGKKAVEMFESSAPGTYDAILMDVQMPEMDGYEATAAIRKLSRPDAKTIQIYAMTANAFTEDISSAFSAGMNGHIAKPIDTAVLYATLNKVVKQNTDGNK